MAPNKRNRGTDWHMWCRLCANEDMQENINIFEKKQQQKDNNFSYSEVPDLSLAAAIEKYFSVKITYDEEIPKWLCTDCYSKVTLLVNFAERVMKVQQLFHVLLNSSTQSQLDLHAMRLKYGILDEDHDQVLQYVHISTEKNVHNELLTTDPLEQIKIEMNVEDEYLMEQSQSEQDTLLKYENSNEEQSQKSHEIKAAPKRKKPRTTISSLSKKRVTRKDKEDSNDKATSVDVESNATERVENNTEGIYTCTKCPRKFQRLGAYQEHLKRKHLPCLQCPKLFMTQRQLEQHSLLHRPVEERKTISCPHCETKFTSHLSLKSHIAIIHLNEFLYICEECGETKRTMQSLKDHMLSHTDEEPFECKFCKKRFKGKRRLKKHMRYHDDIDYVCTECGLQLTCAETLKRHMVVHSDELKFKCNYCGRAFKRSKTLKTHLIIHTGLKPYSCDFCDRTFANASNCRKHKRQIHPEELAEQEAGGVKKITKNIPNLKTLVEM